MNQHKLKSIDLLVESVKSVLTLSTAAIAALLAYIGTIGGGKINKWNLLALVFLFSASITSILNINSLINKVYKGDEEAIMNKEVRGLNIFLSLSLVFGLILSAIYILSCEPEKTKISVPEKHLHIDSSSINVPPDFTTKVIIEKDNSEIKNVIINGDNISGINKVPKVAP